MSDQDIGVILAKLDSLSKTLDELRGEMSSHCKENNDAAIRAAVLDNRVLKLESDILDRVEKRVVLAYLAGVGSVSGGLGAILVKLLA